MANPFERYQNLGIKDSLPVPHRYPIVCKELSYIHRFAYSRVPKNLQSLIFEDSLFAFRILPDMRTKNAVSAAVILLRSAEVALPKQKQNMAVTEFKRARVMHQRHYRACQEEQDDYASCSAQLPYDALVHIFSFLDVQSLASVGLVCKSWNLAASDHTLWQPQYVVYFGQDTNVTHLEKDMTSTPDIDWRQRFRETFLRNSSNRSMMSKRGYCRYCDAVVWHESMKCSRGSCRTRSMDQKIKPVLPQQVVDYLVDGSSFFISYPDSDSDSDSDGGSVSRLWAYPKHIDK